MIYTGIYRERVAPARGGEPGQPIIDEAASDHCPIVRGSDLWMPDWRVERMPVGVHPAFHGQGLGRAILAEGLHRLHRRGAEQVYVETDNDRDAALQTYHSAGFHVEHNVLVYRKDYSINA